LRGKEGSVTYLKILCALILPLVFCSTAHAHSTAGRIRVLLEKEKPEVDDLAYFVEAYVNKEKYRHQYKRFKNRFAVKDFNRIEQAGNRAEIFFTVLDFKEKNRTFPDSMIFERERDGRWIYMEKASAGIPVYTYVNKKRYYIEKYSVVFGPIIVVIVSVAWIFVRRFGQRHGRVRKDNQTGSS
jgi:hypothetical protein